MSGYSTYGHRGAGRTYFFAPYPPPQKPAEASVDKRVVHTPSAYLSSHVLRRRILYNPRFDVRQTYPSSHILHSSSSSLSSPSSPSSSSPWTISSQPTEPVAKPSVAEPSLTDLFLKADVPKSDKQLVEMKVKASKEVRDARETWVDEGFEFEFKTQAGKRKRASACFLPASGSQTAKMGAVVEGNEDEEHRRKRRRSVCDAARDAVVLVVDEVLWVLAGMMCWVKDMGARVWRACTSGWVVGGFLAVVFIGEVSGEKVKEVAEWVVGVIFSDKSEGLVRRLPGLRPGARISVKIY